MRALSGFERDGRGMERRGKREEKTQPTIGKGGENRLKQRETENVLKQLMTTQTAGEGSCLPINEALALICHLDCTSELVRRRGKGI